MTLLLALLPLSWAQQICSTTSTLSTLYNLNQNAGHLSAGYFYFSGTYYAYSAMQSFVVSSATASVAISAYLGYNTLGSAQYFTVYISSATGAGAAGSLIASSAVFVPGPAGTPASPVTCFTGLVLKLLKFRHRSSCDTGLSLAAGTYYLVVYSTAAQYTSTTNWPLWFVNH